MLNEELYESYQRYISQLMNNLPNFIINLKEENEELFLKDLKDLIEGIEWTSKYLAMFDKQIQLNELNVILETINEALKEKNYYLMGNIIEFELISFFKKEIDKI